MTRVLRYAYGAAGVPPAVEPGEALAFEVEAVEYRGNVRTSSSFATDAPLTPRTAGAIKAEYEKRRAARAEAEVLGDLAKADRDAARRDAGLNPLDLAKNAVSDVTEQFSKLYFFGFFESATRAGTKLRGAFKVPSLCAARAGLLNISAKFGASPD